MTVKPSWDWGLWGLWVKGRLSWAFWVLWLSFVRPVRWMWSPVGSMEKAALTSSLSSRMLISNLLLPSSAQSSQGLLNLSLSKVTSWVPSRTFSFTGILFWKWSHHPLSCPCNSLCSLTVCWLYLLSMSAILHFSPSQLPHPWLGTTSSHGVPISLFPVSPRLFVTVFICDLLSYSQSQPTSPLCRNQITLQPCPKPFHGVPVHLA